MRKAAMFSLLCGVLIFLYICSKFGFPDSFWDWLSSLLFCSVASLPWAALHQGLEGYYSKLRRDAGDGALEAFLLPVFAFALLVLVPVVVALA